MLGREACGVGTPSPPSHPWGSFIRVQLLGVCVCPYHKGASCPLQAGPGWRGALQAQGAEDPKTLAQ